MVKVDLKNILISRTDSIGDVVLTLPMAGWLRENYPNSKISFLARNYTAPIVALSSNIDEFISYDELSSLPVSSQLSFLETKNIDCVLHVFPQLQISSLMKKAAIKIRVGTKNRMQHWFHCNSLVNLSRKNSDLHEAQLNFKLLQPLGLDKIPDAEKIHEWYGFIKLPILEEKYRSLLSIEKENIILHPKSKGSAREWGLENFSELIKHLPSEKYKIFISGSADEGKMCKDIFDMHPDVTDLTGKMNLSQFIAFINESSAIVAASTGPLHIAAALNKKAIGLFAPMRPIHPGRWSPLGKRVKVLVKEKNCEDCRKSQNCHCIREIGVHEVISALASL